MKHPHTRIIVMLTCCLLLAATLLPALKEHSAGLTAAAPAADTASELSLRLGAEESLLESRRAELAALLREYELGRAGFKETANLIAEVEGIRLRVEDLRAELAQSEEWP